MAKTKPVRRRSGVQRQSKAKVLATARRPGRLRKKAQGRPNAQRPSGHQHRKKSETRRSTHRLVRGVMEFASHGLWPLGKNDWLRVDEPTQPGMGVFSPMLAALQDYVTARLDRILAARTAPRTTGDSPCDSALAKLMEAGIQESRTRGAADTGFQQVSAASAICQRILDHLEEPGRRDNVYRCSTCNRWFFAWRHDPRKKRTPYCSRRCWPSADFRDVVAAGRRVQAWKTKTPQ